MFVVRKLEPAPDPFFLGCRHCNFLAFDITIMWIHFEVGHGVPDILESSSLQPSAVSPPSNFLPLSINEIILSDKSFLCLECNLVSTHSAQTILNHCLFSHQDLDHFNGCFLKLKMILKPENADSVTYSDAINDEKYDKYCQDLYICAWCDDYSTHCSFAALSHNLLKHQKKKLLYVCGECSYQCLSDENMKTHLKMDHQKGNFCTATVVEILENGMLAECEIPKRVEPNNLSGAGIVEAPMAVENDTVSSIVVGNALSPCANNDVASPSASENNSADQETASADI